MSAAHLNCIIRRAENSNLGIRGTFSRLETLGDHELLLINEVSDKGTMLLEPGSYLRVEVMGMPTRVIFETKIQRKTAEGLLVFIPEVLVSYERRQSARYNTVPKHTAYLKLSIWEPTSRDIAAPPILEPYENLASFCPISDISIGGMCIFTHFPSVLTKVEADQIDPQAQVILPMMHPVELPVEFRWQKRTINRIVERGVEKSQLQFRFGVQFSEVDQKVIKVIKQFMRQLSMADAI